MYAASRGRQRNESGWLLEGHGQEHGHLKGFSLRSMLLERLCLFLQVSETKHRAALRCASFSFLTVAFVFVGCKYCTNIVLLYLEQQLGLARLMHARQ